MALMGDNPIEAQSDDRLERRPAAQALARDIREADATHGYVISIVGPWGSGKTSMINMIREALTDAPEITVIDFNPWMFSGTEQLMTGFLNELSSQLRLRDPKLDQVSTLIKDYSDLFEPAEALPFIGTWVANTRRVVTHVQRFQEKQRGSVTEQRKKISDALRLLDQPIVFVIDDIDRLDASEIRDIFKLVRLTASFPNIIYILSFDRERVEQALAHSGFDGRAYLEKIVQLTIAIPSIPEEALLTEITSTLNDAMGQLDADVRFNADLWPDVLWEVVMPLLHNMRDVKRYAAAVRSKLRLLGQNVELVDILALEAVRLFLPNTFGRMLQERSVLTDTDSYVKGDSERLSMQVRRIIEAGDEHEDVVRAVINRLFPAAASHVGGMNYGPDWHESWLHDRRVAHPDVLAAYLEQAQNAKIRALNQAEALCATPLPPHEIEARLDACAPSELGNLITALGTFAEKVPEESIAPLCIALYKQIPRVPEQDQGLFSLDGVSIISYLTLRLIKRSSDKIEIASMATQIYEKVSLTARLRLVEQVGHLENFGHNLISVPDAEDLQHRLASDIRAASADDLAREPEALRLLLAPTRLAGAPVRTVQPGELELSKAVLRGALTYSRRQSLGNRAVSRSPRLVWDAVVEAFGSEEDVRQAVLAMRDLADPTLTDLLDLTESYLEGWRPPEWGER